ncbi:MAG: diaminopimelate epimerase [Bacteroidetes bacterium HGW-Bacteroidetes-4]|jgi:diaminopimelate epimerase|nr:MAG: diaminopimelate epimerase [Bacteroidetes bacterium HGW-Bacteroidetes-4]
MTQEIAFSKYHGTGNDFILINAFNKSIELSEQAIQTMCHRRYGIGADGLIVLRRKEGFDFFMDFYNSDGKPGSMCGNGGRCIVSFAHDLGLIKNETRFFAPDGPHKAIYESADKISLKMADVTDIEPHDLGLFINTGSPHLVIDKSKQTTFNVYTEGRKIRNEKKYKAEGVNVNFFQVKQNITKIFTYERGVEDETYSCGTGTVATALTLNQLFGNSSPVTLQAKGGLLKVHFSKKDANNYTDIWLEGPTKKTFTGTYLLD